ncbi:MAG: HAD family hydrolase [Gemmatimonadales bacterium]|nr:MAG: HAD family hydrolase [Gemmatimonadales bacterium]
MTSPPPWHARPAEEALAELESHGEQGLEPAEAGRRLEEFGPNRLEEEEGPGALRRLLVQFNNILIWILLVAAVFTAVLGEWIDTGVILAVVVVNAVIGFVQEGRAEEAMAGIRQLLSPDAEVIRGGARRSIPAEELVPGDLVHLTSGDRVPADLRVVRARNARVEEAALTGESVPVEKSPEPVAPDRLPGDRTSMAFSGTLVVSGRITGVVIATGTETEIGRIGGMVRDVESVTTPLLQQIHRFGQQLSIAITGAAVALFLWGWLVSGLPMAELFLSAVALAVAAIPEGLPAILTITLALGVQRMAGRNAVIRRLPAVETLGSVTVICTDKTGTLTRNEMAVEQVLLPGRSWHVEGTGYEPEGSFRRGATEGPTDGTPDTPPAEPASDLGLMALARAGLLCNEAEFSPPGPDAPDGTPELHGDPTEGALLVLAARTGLVRSKEEEDLPRKDLVPFESERRWMASLHAMPAGGRVLLAKGAPERILDHCSHQAPSDPDLDPLDPSHLEQGIAPLDREHWLEEVEAVASGGYRVLALAARPLPKDASDPRSDADSSLDAEKAGSDWVLLGLAALMDPPRPEAIQAVEDCHGAGIRVVMITGDHAATATSIGARMGIGDASTPALAGAEIEEASDEELGGLLDGRPVIARASPEHKLRIVRHLQARGEVCAMTGDGVNDAPALRQADIGVAMGIKGSEAARSASEMVLADDNFASIEKAVEEGRTVWDNLRKTLLFILPTNGAEALLVLVAVILAMPYLPITPVQILWVNMVTAVTLALALAFEPTEPGVMSRPPRPPGTPLLSAALVRRIAWVSVVVGGGCLFLFNREIRAGADPAYARTLVVNALVMAELFYLLNCRFLWRASLGPRALAGNPALWIAIGALLVLQLGFTYLPVLQTALGSEPLTPTSWGWAVALGITVFILVELEKAWGRRQGLPTRTASPTPPRAPHS